MKRHSKYLVNVTNHGAVYSSRTGKLLKPRQTPYGYWEVTVYDPELDKYLLRKVHRLVAQVYIPNPENKREVNHIDCDKSNNHVSNLEWVTSKENKSHAWDNNLYTCVGENHVNSKLTNDEVHQICSLIEQGYRNKDLAEKFGCDRTTISDIRRGFKWKRIGSQYKMNVKRNSRKDPTTVIKVAELLEQKKSKKYIEKVTGVPIYDINRIKRRAIFKDLTKDFNF